MIGCKDYAHSTYSDALSGYQVYIKKEPLLVLA